MKENHIGKIKTLMVAIVMIASAMFVFGIVENTKAAASDLFDGTLAITSPAQGDFVSGVVNITWSGVNIAGGIYPITYNVTFSMVNGTGGDKWTRDGGNLSHNGGNATYYLWNTTSSGYKLPDGTYWVNVTATACTALDLQWVNATSHKLVLRNTLPGTPGVNLWQGGRHWLYNDTTTLANYYQQVIRTPATSSLYAGAEDVDITLNNSLAWDSGETYYLWKPVYNGSKGTPSLYSLDWVRYGVSPGQYVTGSSTSAMAFDNIDLDRAGLWLICEGNEAWGSNANYRTIETYNSTGFAWFWVNSSKDYTLTMSDTAWDYNDTGDLTFTVKDSADTETEAMVDIRCDQTGNSTYGESRFAETGTYTYTNGKNNTHFWEVGNYTAYAYVDSDYYTTANGKQYYTENAMDGTTDDAHYNETYGANANKNNSASWLSTYATSYNWSACGPWDPPEHNATVIPVVVSTKTPYTLVATGNSTMYWGFDGEVNFTLGETSTGTTFPNSNVKIWIFDDDGVNVSQYFDLYESTDGADNTGTRRASCPEGGDSRPGRIVIHNDAYRSGYIHINMTNWGQNHSWNKGFADNGTWKAYIYIDYNADRNLNGENKEWSEEWNATVEWTVGAGPDAQFKWVDDDGSVGGTDLWGYQKKNNDGIIPYIPTATNVPLDVEFNIYGSDGTYFGQTPSGTYSGSCQSVQECAENITISGNSLFTGKLSDFPGYGLSTTACGYSSGVWSVPIVPTMSLGGGEITIAITAFNSSCSETISIGGENYETNGSIVSVTPNDFMIDQENKTLTITVKNSQTGTENPYMSVYLYYLDDGTITAANTMKPITGHTVDRVEAVNGVYTIPFNTTQQTFNQTTGLNGLGGAGFSAYKAPRNLTVYVSGSNHREGYALIQMKPVNDLETHISQETFMAGHKYNDVIISCDFAGNSTDTPSTRAADKNSFYMKIVDANGNDVTGTTSSNGVLHNFYDSVLTGTDAYSFEKDNVYGLDAGTYSIYAWNNTHTSEGHNATFEIKAVGVVCDKAPFIWSVDANISATFTITYDGSPANGTLRIDNMTDKGPYNKTWTNCSFNGNTDAGGNTSLQISKTKITNGVVTVHDISADALHPNVAKQYITFWFKPDSSGSVFAKAQARMNVEVPTVTPDPMYIPLGRTTKVYCTATGRGELLEGVYVRLHGQGFNGSSLTDVDGRVAFSVTPATTGNISIDVGEINRTLSDTVVKVVAWVIDVDVVAEVNEGGDFTVTVTKEGTTDVVVGAIVTIKGIGTATTDANGQVTFTAPDVTSDRTYTIKVTAVGYAPDPDTNTITVINVPKLILVIPDEVQATATFEVAVADDTGGAIVGAIISFDDKTYTTGVGGVAKLTAPKTEGSYPIEAAFGNYEKAIDIVTVTAAPGIPGFELLSLIAALGVAFILFRRRRR